MLAMKNMAHNTSFLSDIQATDSTWSGCMPKKSAGTKPAAKTPGAESGLTIVISLTESTATSAVFTVWIMMFSR